MISFKKVFIIIGGTLLFTYILFMALYFPTSEPSFCGTCHLVKPYVTSWRESPHKTVKCLFCHEPRGFFGKFHSKSRGLNYVYQQATNQYTALDRAVIFELNCIACHLGDNKQHPNAIKLTNKSVNHYQIIMKKTSCLKCHAETGHKNRFYLNPEFKKLWK
jgi:cytochrome c nitrite reductase small subunit